MENEMNVTLENESGIIGPHVFVGCMPFAKQCLMPNYRDYPDDKRMKKLEEVLNDYSSNMISSRRVCKIRRNELYLWQHR